MWEGRVKVKVIIDPALYCAAGDEIQVLLVVLYVTYYVVCTKYGISIRAPRSIPGFTLFGVLISMDPKKPRSS